MNDDADRCPECGSWGLECLSEKPVPGCGCARCLSAALRSEKASATRGWQQADSLHLTVKELKDEIEQLRAWQLAVAEGTGYINHAEGQDGYEVADAETIVAAWKRRERRYDEAHDVAQAQREVCAESLEAMSCSCNERVRLTPLVTEEKP